VPGWPLIRFFITYVLRLGFLEGRPGFVYCANLAYYEFLIRIKRREEIARRRQAAAEKPEPARAPVSKLEKAESGKA